MSLLDFFKPKRNRPLSTRGYRYTSAKELANGRFQLRGQKIESDGRIKRKTQIIDLTKLQSIAGKFVSRRQVHPISYPFDQRVVYTFKLKQAPEQTFQLDVLVGSDAHHHFDQKTGHTQRMAKQQLAQLQLLRRLNQMVNYQQQQNKKQQLP